MTSSHPREISERGILLILLAVGLLPLLGDATFGSWSEEDRGLGVLMVILASVGLLQDLLLPRR